MRRREGLRAGHVRGVAQCGAVDGPVKHEQVTVVLGSQWGDEGKGKLVDVLAQTRDVVCRCQGGANAGHTIYDDAGKKYALHLVPSGILSKRALNVVGNGVVVHLPTFYEELRKLEAAGVPTEGRIVISDRAHVLFDLHKEVDGLREAELEGEMIGTTKRGIGPCYSSKATRNGLRVCDLVGDFDKFSAKFRAMVAGEKKRFKGMPQMDAYDADAELVRYREYADKVRPLVTDTALVVHDALRDGKEMLIEGANATLLDIDFGTYPYVTSSNPSMGGILTGIGIPPHKIGAIIGVVKAYTTRVGEGPYPTELHGELAEKLREEGGEYGTTTGRPRRIGWLDIPALRFSHMINGFTHLNLTKLDVLSILPEIKIGVKYIRPDGTECRSMPGDLDELASFRVEYETMEGWMCDISKCRQFEELPPQAQRYIERIEALMGGVECTWTGVGAGRADMVLRH